MFKKTIFTSFFILASFFAFSGNSYSQDDGTVVFKIEIPDIFGGTYDENGYDKEGYDRSGYNRNGYDRNGYDRYGYDMYGYDRYGYNKNGYNREGYDRNGNYVRENDYYYEKSKKKGDNGKHKGWYKKKHKNDDRNTDPVYEEKESDPDNSGDYDEKYKGRK